MARRVLYVAGFITKQENDCNAQNTEKKPSDDSARNDNKSISSVDGGALSTSKVIM